MMICLIEDSTSGVAGKFQREITARPRAPCRYIRLTAKSNSRIPGSKAGAEVRLLDGVRQRSVVCGKGAIFAEATTQPRLPHLDPTQIRRPEAAPARPVTLLSSLTGT